MPWDKRQQVDAEPDEMYHGSGMDSRVQLPYGRSIVFTGIVEEVGSIVRVERGGEVLGLEIRAGFSPESVAPGDSVAVDGVCLTVTKSEQGVLRFDLSHETAGATTLRDRIAGDRVHLERALALGGRLGGHLVTGHVDGTGDLVRREPRGENLDLVLRAPAAVVPYLVPKGSVAIDGVSLTVNQPQGSLFRVTLVPHTLRQTTLGERRPGEALNLEADILGKYVRHFTGSAAGPGGGVDRQMLVEHGFLAPDGDS